MFEGLLLFAADMFLFDFSVQYLFFLLGNDMYLCEKDYFMFVWQKICSCSCLSVRLLFYVFENDMYLCENDILVCGNDMSAFEVMVPHENNP